MRFTALDNTTLLFRREMPREFAPYKIIGATPFFAASDQLGKFFYQEYLSHEYNFWLSCFKPAKDLKLLTQHFSPWVGMRLILKDNIQMAYDRQEFNLRQGQYNFSYLPKAESISSLRAGAEYIIFDLQLGKKLLQSLPGKFWTNNPHFSFKNAKPYFWAKAAPCRMSLLERVEEFLKIPSDMFLCMEILHLISRPDTSNLDPKNLKDIQIAQMFKARTILKSDLGKKYTLVNVAKMVGTNKTYLKTQFRQVFGITPFQYVTDKRDEMVKWYLLHTDFDLEMIARQVGLQPYTSLIHSFKARNGIAPMEWRKKYK